MRNRIAIVVCIFFLIVIAFQFGCRTFGDYSSTGASSTPAQGVTITGNIVVNEIETGNLADIRMAVASGSIVSFSSFIANLIR